MRFVGRFAEFARDFFNLAARHAADLLRPGGRIGAHVAVVARAVGVIKAAVQAVVGQGQIINRGDRQLTAVGQRQHFDRHFMQQHLFLFHVAEMGILDAAEVREGDIHNRIAPVEQRQRQLRRRACRFRLEVPFAFFAPAEAD